jgi:ferric-dicitrate binding protein FerR (iron transport regulator)
MSNANLIYRVLRGVASEDEREELSRWLGRSAANREEYENLKLVYRYSWHVRGAVKDTRYYERLEHIRRTAGARLNRKVRARRVLRLVGALACIALAVFVWSHAIFDFRPTSLHFQDQTLGHVLSRIERSYGIEVQVEKGALESCRFTGTFYRVDRPDDVIRSISRAINAELVSTAPGKYRLLGGC